MQESVGLRVRKRRDTHRRLSTAARQLVIARGLDAVSVEDIAAAADVSVRTFFNYFACKEEAIVGVEPVVIDEIAADLRARPSEEPPVDALRNVLLSEDADAEGMLERWRQRTELVDRYPALLPRYLAAMVQVEEKLAEAVADRLGVDPRADARPRVLVATTLAVLRAALAWWDQSDQRTPLLDVVDRSFIELVSDLSRQP